MKARRTNPWRAPAGLTARSALYCGPNRIYRLKVSSTERCVLKCGARRKQFSVMIGTIFEDLHLPLTYWLAAIHVMCASKKGISAHQFHRLLGITYKSAWFIRYAMMDRSATDRLGGVVGTFHHAGTHHFASNWPIHAAFMFPGNGPPFRRSRYLEC